MVSINEAVFQKGIQDTERRSKTAIHKIDALLDLLEKKGIIEADEAKLIRDAKVY